MHGWKTVSLGDVCVIEKTKYKDGELPYVGMEDIVSGTGKFVGSREPKKAGSSTFQFTREHLLYGRLRPYLNKVLLPDFEGHCSSEIFPLLPKAELDKSFLFYWITNEQVVEEINRTCTGARMPRANVNEVLKFYIPIPPIEEQKRIVAILDEAFAGIDTAIANTEKNLANARELFESYLNAVFSKQGDGWEEKSINEIAELIDSLHKTPKYIENGGYPMIRVTDIKDGTINFEKARRVDEETFIEFSKRHSSQIGDLVLSRVGTYGVPALVTSPEQFCLGQNTVFVVPTINSKMLYYFLRSPVSKEQVDKLVAGTTQPTISLKSIKSIRIPIPPSNEQKQIVESLDAYLGEVKRLEVIYQQKLNSLTELKQSLLQKAFSGELTTEGDKLMDEAVA